MAKNESQERMKMGASEFLISVKAKTAEEAFSIATKDARYEYGHGGYTGSIAEKNSFVMISVPEGKDPRNFAEELMDNDDSRIGKHGPAGCIKLKEDKWYFFGFASS